MTEEEKEILIETIVERTLLRLPQAIGSLISHHVALAKLREDFYKRNPSFSEHKEVVSLVVSQLENDYPGIDYKEIITRAEPIIKERIQVMAQLDFDNFSVPSRRLKE